MADREIGASLLYRLIGEEFERTLQLVTSSVGLRRALMKSEEVRQVAKGIRLGSITESAVRRFTEEMLKDFERGQLFCHDFAFAAIAVAVQDIPIDFAEEYLLHLAKLNVTEMPLSPRVARLCLQSYDKRPRTKTKETRFPNTGRTARHRDRRGSGIIAPNGIVIALLMHQTTTLGVARQIHRMQYTDAVLNAQT